jgi:hypothetical protein
MYQGLEWSISDIVPEALESGILTSLCTITVPPGVFDAGGAPDPSAAYTDLDGHTLIPCTTPPLSQILRPTEVKSLEEVMTRNMLHVWLAGYYPAILTEYRAQIGKSDGHGGIASPETYDIVGVEWDSQNRSTRLAVQLASE